MTVTPTGLSPSVAGFSKTVQLPAIKRQGVCCLLPLRPATPMRQRQQAITSHRFRLIPFRSPLLRDSRLISFPRGTEMFHFPRLPSPCLLNSAGDSQGFPQVGCPIRISPDHGLFAPPRGLSQLTTSFIVFQHQGIHHMPFRA
jgi:hypothetical protein